jgi:membrane protease YdiL (CAAX protease family)
LLSLFAGSIELARAIVPYGTQLVLSTWSPFLADMFGMWSVGIAGLLALALTDRSMSSIGFALPARRYLVLGSAIPVAYCAAIYVPVWLFAPWTFAGTAALSAGAAASLFHLPRSLFAAAGEELGWRGVLVPNLATVASPVSALLAPGMLWALWHYPDILFFGYNVGTPSVFALICFSIGLVGTGACLSWLRLASGSLWPAVLFHGVHNAVIWGVFERATSKGGATAYFMTEFGAGFALVGVAVGFASVRYGATAGDPALQPQGEFGRRRP